MDRITKKDENFFFKNSAGDNIAAVLSNPKNPNGYGIILLHCFTCTKHHRIMRNLSDSLNEQGFTTLRFDFSGNGESEGKLEDATYSKMIIEVKETVSILKKKNIKKIGLAGHSMGAMISLLAASADNRIDAVAFIAGSSEAARVKQIFPKEVLDKAEKEGCAESFVYGRTIKIKREFLQDIEKYNVKSVVSHLHRPLLIVHGSADSVIVPSHATHLYGWASEPKKLELINGADHLFSDKAHLEKLNSVVSDWFNKNL